MICVGKEGLVGISITYIEAWVVALEERSRVVSPAEARSVPGCWSLPVLLLLDIVKCFTLPWQPAGEAGEQVMPGDGGWKHILVSQHYLSRLLPWLASVAPSR